MTAETAGQKMWPTLIYANAVGAIEFLGEAFGFEPLIVVPNDTDPNVIEHCQLRMTEVGSVMLGSAGRPGNIFADRPTGTSSVYVVVPDPDAVYDRAVAAGAEVLAPLIDADYGSRGFTVADPEGNIWSFGTYGGEP